MVNSISYPKINFNFDDYLYFEESLEIRMYLNKHYILFINSRRRDEESNILLEDKYKINDVAKEIIELIDGSYTYRQIIEKLSSKYNEDATLIQSKVDSFLYLIQESYKLRILSNSISITNKITIRNETNVYPTVASIELTYRCNIKCLHCYGGFGGKEKSTMEFARVRQLLIDLKNMGVPIVEFTGGDITMHPQLNDIIEEALNLDFIQISLLTNGLALSKQTCDLIIDNRSKITIQIDVHSLDDSYLHWFTKVPNTLDRIKNLLFI